MSCIPVIFSLKPGAFVWIDKCHSVVFFDKYPVSALMEYFFYFIILKAEKRGLCSLHLSDKKKVIFS